MVLSYYGRKTTVAEARAQCGPDRDGLTARAIAAAAREFGLRVKAYSVELANFNYLSLPLIAHWDFNHFVVVEKWSPRAVEIVDPSVGRRKVSASEFAASLTGVVLTLEPGVQFQPRPRVGGPLWLKYLKSMLNTSGSWGSLGQILLGSLVLQALGLIQPIVTKVLVDQILPFHLKDVMTVLGIGMVLFALSQMALSYLRGTLFIYLRGRLDSQLMLSFFEHLLTLPFSFFQRRTSGDLLMRLASNGLIREVLTNQTISVILDGSFALVYLLILLALSPRFSVVVVTLGVLQVAVLLLTRSRTRLFAQRDLASKAAEQSYLVEAMKGVALIKASGAEDRVLDRWSNLFFNQLNISLERGHFGLLIDTAVGALRTLAPLLLLWYGAVQVLNGNMKLGTMLALNSLASSFLGPIATLVASAQQFIMVGAQLERIADVLDAEPEPALRGCEPAAPLTGGIELRNVSFRYASNSPMVLRDVSFAVGAGQKVALVGPTGSGKSTLAMLLLGLFRPTGGEILYDGVPLEKLSLRAFRAQFGVVLQEPFLFSGSIRQNINLNNPDMSLDDTILASVMATIHSEIAEMPMSYETLVAEGGTTLSGGQRQRLSIARALAHKPRILILDEATSHLDVKTEAELDENLNRLPCTRIVIAHRLSTVRNADQIIVLDGGRVVEQGSHDELMATRGRYAALVKSQLKGASPAASLSETNPDWLAANPVDPCCALASSGTSPSPAPGCEPSATSGLWSDPREACEGSYEMKFKI
jgi:ABC-type bacteriocin/lantibiotic exporter with double-glycine peptidase domain